MSLWRFYTVQQRGDAWGEVRKAGWLSITLDYAGIFFVDLSSRMPLSRIGDWIYQLGSRLLQTSRNRETLVTRVSLTQAEVDKLLCSTRRHDPSEED